MTMMQDIFLFTKYDEKLCYVCEMARPFAALSHCYIHISNIHIYIFTYLYMADDLFKGTPHTMKTDLMMEDLFVALYHH